MKPRAVIAGITIAALLFGWWIAAPDYAGMSFDDVTAPLADADDAFSTREFLQPALEDLIQRQAFSAPESATEVAEEKTADEPESKQPVIKAPPPPTGLDRFQLVALIRVAGRPAEAILIDRGRGGVDMVTANEGTVLGDSDVTLIRIEDTRILLENEAESRWLTLFPRAASVSATMVSLSQ